MDTDFSQLDLIEAPVFVLAPDATGTPVYVAFNAYARRGSGRPLSDYLGKSAKEVYDQAYGQTAEQRHREALEHGRAIEYELELPVGEQTILVRTCLVPCMGKNGKVAYLYGTSRNITAEQEVSQKRVNLGTVLSEMEQFVALAAHDLRAPMRNISLLADMLMEDFEDRGDGKLELIRMLEEVSTKSLGLITEVLGNAQSMTPAQQARQFNFAALCYDIKDILDPRCVHLITASGAEIVADRTAMQIALRNVIENAFKHGKRDRIEISISVKEADQKGLLRVELRDNGRGFTEEALKFLSGGKFGVESGYGLHGVKRLLMARGGTIEVRNRREVPGSCISFTLPGTWVRATSSIGDLPSDPLLAPTLVAAPILRAH